MGVSHATVCSNWVASIEGREDFSLRPSHLRGSRVSASGDSILSYGWWSMADIIRTRKGEPNFWLINGDRYSSSTSGHQSQVRGAISGSRFPSIIIPYTALGAAGCDPDSIEPLEIRADRIEKFQHSIPADFAMPTLRPVDHSRSEARSERGELKVHGHTFSAHHYTRWYDYELSAYADCDELSHYVDGCSADLRGGAWHWETTRHWLGDSLFSARVTEERTRNASPEEIELFKRRAAWDEARRVAGFPYPDTLEYASLMDEFHSEPERSNVRESEGVYTVRETRERRATFLSSFDYQERIPLYFLCELPRKAKVSTVEEAYEALKPPLVQMAEAAGLEVARQGDIFAIPTELSTAEVKRLTPRGKGRIVKRPPQVLGTNHSPSEVLFATRDRIYARGCLYHDPGRWRAPDHARRKLGDGKTWHLLMRNTVPRSRSATTTTRRRINR